MFDVTVDSKVSDIWSGEAVIGIVCLEDITQTSAAGPELKREVRSTVADLRAAGNAALEDPMLQRMRTTFKAVPDMDPHRYRPASEALIRRSLEKDFIRINPIVDVNNLLSIKLRIPLGVYDLDRVSEHCVYRLGYAGETYLTISNMEKNADGKLVLADDEGVVGSPVSDSGRAIIRNDTSRIAVLGYFPFDVPKAEAQSACSEIEATFKRILRAKPSHMSVVTKLPS